jgi:hypothetical protein
MKNKIFIIGLNKTGTSSMQQYFELLGYNVGNQIESELIIRDILLLKQKYSNNTKKFNLLKESECVPLFNYIDKYDVFQDVPFSYPFFYILLIRKYPNSKFIFTTRKNAEEWANSLTNFHINVFSNKCITNHLIYGDHYNIITKYLFNTMGFSDNKLWYNKSKMIKFYNKYVNTVLNDFKNNKLFLCFNINDPNKQQLIHAFLGTQINANIPFPHWLKTN